MSFGFAAAVITKGTRGSRPRPTGARARRAPSAGRMTRYVAREGNEYAARRDNLPDEIISSGAENLPAWAEGSATRFFEAADKFERANGRRADLRIVTLPRGMSDEDYVRTAQEIGQELFGERHPYSWTVHNSVAADGGTQPHVHYVSSSRIVDGIERDTSEQWFRQYNARAPGKGGAKKAWVSGVSRADRAAALMANREAVAAIINTNLQRAGLDRRVDARSNIDQGLPPPEKKLPISERKNPTAKALLQSERDLKKASAAADTAMADYANRRAPAARQQQTPIARHPDDVAHTDRSRRAQAVRAAKSRRLEENAATARKPQAPIADETPNLQETSRQRRADAIEVTRQRRAAELALAQREAARETAAAAAAAAKTRRQEELRNRAHQARKPQPATFAEPADLTALGQQRKADARSQASARINRERTTQNLVDRALAAATRRGMAPAPAPQAATRPSPAPTPAPTPAPPPAPHRTGTSPVPLREIREILSDESVIAVGKAGQSFILTTRGSVWNGKPGPGMSGLGPDLAAIGVKPAKRAEPLPGNWFRIELPLADLVAGLARLGRDKIIEWMGRLKEATKESRANELDSARAPATKVAPSQSIPRRGKGPGIGD